MELRKRTFICPHINPKYIIGKPIVNESHCKSFAHGEGCMYWCNKKGCKEKVKNNKDYLKRFEEIQQRHEQEIKNSWKDKKDNNNFNVSLAGLIIVSSFLNNIILI